MGVQLIRIVSLESILQACMPKVCCVTIPRHFSHLRAGCQGNLMLDVAVKAEILIANKNCDSSKPANRSLTAPRRHSLTYAQHCMALKCQPPGEASGVGQDAEYVVPTT